MTNAELKRDLIIALLITYLMCGMAGLALGWVLAGFTALVATVWIAAVLVIFR